MRRVCPRCREKPGRRPKDKYCKVCRNLFTKEHRERVYQERMQARVTIKELRLELMKVKADLAAFRSLLSSTLKR